MISMVTIPAILWTVFKNISELQQKATASFYVYSDSQTSMLWADARGAANSNNS